MRKILADEPKRFGDEYPPTRPTLMTLVIATAIIGGGAAIVNWQAISSFIHYPQIMAGLGL